MSHHSDQRVVENVWWRWRLWQQQQFDPFIHESRVLDISGLAVALESGTNTTSNRSATIRQLQDDNTDDDVGSAVFTDEEGSVGPDFH